MCSWLPYLLLSIIFRNKHQKHLEFLDTRTVTPHFLHSLFKLKRKEIGKGWWGFWTYWANQNWIASLCDSYKLKSTFTPNQNIWLPVLWNFQKANQYTGFFFVQSWRTVVCQKKPEPDTCISSESPSSEHLFRYAFINYDCFLS